MERTRGKLWLVWLLVLGLFAAGGLFRVLFHDRYLRGSDAYYYALQANYWSKTGEVKIPDSSVIHRITGSLQQAGLSTETAVHLWEVVSLYLFFLSLLGLAMFRGNLARLFSLLLLHYTWLSPSLLFTALEFPKLFLMLLFIPFWFYPLLFAEKKWWLCLLAAFFTCCLHRAAVPLALGFSAVVLLAKAELWTRAWRRRLPLVLGLVGLLAILYYFGIRDRMHFSDFDRLHWNHLQVGLVSLLKRQGLPTALKIELITLPACFAFSLIQGGAKTARKTRLLLCALLPLFLPAFFPLGTDEVFSVGERYALLVPVFSLLGLLLLETESSAGPTLNWNRGLLVMALGLLIPPSSAYRLALFHPVSLDPDFASYDRIASELATTDIPMLVANKEVVFFYKFKLMREAFPYEPESHWNKSRIWRLLYKITPEELYHYVSPNCQLDAGLWKPLSEQDYMLIREDCWETARSRITEAEDSDLYFRAWGSWLNPSQKRPAFLYPKHAEDEDSEFPALPPKK